MPQIAFTTDVAGRLQYVNERWLAYTGLSLEATLRRTQIAKADAR